MSIKPFAHLCPKPTKKSFFATDIPAADLEELATNNYEWSIIKMVLLHKNCPDKVTEEFLTDPIWYRRLTAGLAKNKRAKYIQKLFDDKKSTVRAAAYKTAIIEEIGNIQDICKRIVNDEFVRNYFHGYSFWKIEWISLVASGTWSRADWDVAANTSQDF